MSVDKNVTKKVLATLADGRDGYLKGAEKLAESDSAELAGVFARYGEQRSSFHHQLETLAVNDSDDGDDFDDDGSVAAMVHRGWMTLKDVLSGPDPSGVLEAAAGGESHAIGVYEDALSQEISPALRRVLDEQVMEIRSAEVDIVKMQGAAHAAR